MKIEPTIHNSYEMIITACHKRITSNSPAVQLADVMIGAAIEMAQRITGRISNGLEPEAVLRLYADDQLIHMLPSLDIEDQIAFREGTLSHPHHLPGWSLRGSGLSIDAVLD